MTGLHVINVRPLRPGLRVFRPLLVPAPDCLWGIVGCDAFVVRCCGTNCVNSPSLFPELHCSLLNRFARAFVNVLKVLDIIHIHKFLLGFVLISIPPAWV